MLIDFRELWFGIRWNKEFIGKQPNNEDLYVYTLIVGIPVISFVFTWDNYE